MNKAKSILFSIVFTTLRAVLTIFIMLSFILILSLVLSERGTSIFGVRSYVVSIGSAGEVYRGGSFVFVREKHADQIALEDNLTYRPGIGGGQVTYKVIEITDIDGATVFITQHNTTHTTDTETVLPYQIIGTAFFGVGGLGTFLLALTRPFNFIICLLLLVAMLIVPTLFKTSKK